MINLPIKVLIGAGAAGAAGAVGLGGYGIYSVAFKSSSKTIAQALAGEGKVLLSFDSTADDSIWNSNVSKFPTSDSQAVLLEGFTKATEGDNNEAKNREAMKSACKTLSSTVFDESKANIKDQVKTWCTKDKTSPQ